MIPGPMNRAVEKTARLYEVRASLAGVWIEYIASRKSSFVPYKPAGRQPARS